MPIKITATTMNGNSKGNKLQSPVLMLNPAAGKVLVITTKPIAAKTAVSKDPNTNPIALAN